MKFVIGIDEAGRGPLAGPVAVGIVVAPIDFDIRKAFPGVHDSKQLTEKKREEIYMQLQVASGKLKIKVGQDANGKIKEEIRYLVVFASAEVIDTKGITYAVRSSIYKGIRKLGVLPHECHILLDGLLKAPPEYSQTTIVGGDASDAIISLASIAAKVERDRLMRRLAKKHPGYGFEQHKGYGTPGHLAALSQFGPCAIHRKTFGRVGVPFS